MRGSRASTRLSVRVLFDDTISINILVHLLRFVSLLHALQPAGLSENPNPTRTNITQMKTLHQAATRDTIVSNAFHQSCKERVSKHSCAYSHFVQYSTKFSTNIHSIQLGTKFVQYEIQNNFSERFIIGRFHRRHGRNASWEWRRCYCAPLPIGRTAVRSHSRVFSLLHMFFVRNGFLRSSRLQ